MDLRMVTLTDPSPQKKKFDRQKEKDVNDCCE